MNKMQIPLPKFQSLYRCHDCGRDVERVTRLRRFRLCDGCYARIAPDTSLDNYSPKFIAQVKRFNEWLYEMDKRYPTRMVWSRNTGGDLLRQVDDYYPFCQCGKLRRRVVFGEPGIFGGPYFRLCPECEARETVLSIFQFRDAIHPDFDDEDWLDLLYKAHRECFDVGVLPDMWFELREVA